MVSLETLEFLLSDDGSELLRVAKQLHGTLVQRIAALRKRYPADAASAAMELLDLRDRARKKFTKADEMFFTREALEQASGESISSYRSERYSPDTRVLEIGCGIGGDTIHLAKRCFVTAVDSDPIRLKMAERNAQVYGVAERVTFVCEKAGNIQLDADAAFVDPSRRFEGKRSTSLKEMSPSLDFLHKLLRHIPNCGIKLSPATDDIELESFGGEIEFISDSGECKEAVIWLGDLKSASKRATILPKRDTLVQGRAGQSPLQDPSNYLYEPDPCVIRSHLIDQVAGSIGAGRIDDQIAFLTSEFLVETPFARAFRIVESLPFNLRVVNQHLRELDAGRVIVKKRGVPFEPKDIESRLKKSGRKEYVLVATRVRGRMWAFICAYPKKDEQLDT